MRKCGGFTLMEVLIAMSIVVIVAAISFTVFRGAAQSWQRGELRAETYQSARAVVETISNELSQSLGSSTWTVGQPAQALFVGSEQAVHFTAPFGRQREPIEIGYALHDGGLWRREAQVPDGDSETVDTDERVSTNVEALSFAFFDGEQWLTVWDAADRQALPAAVRIEVTIRGRPFTTVAKIRTGSTP